MAFFNSANPETGVYLVKPFAFAELIARARTLLRRGKTTIIESQFQLADLSLDLVSRKVMRAGERINLTNQEFSLLEYFLRNQGRVIPRAELSKHVWNVDFDTGTNMVEVYVNYLRKKIDKDFESKLIHTQFGMGYILKES